MEIEFEVAEGLKLKDWQELQHGLSTKVFMTIIYSTILVLGIIGNSVTIKVTQVLMRKGYLQKNVTDHMVSLACSDLLVLLIGMPVELYSATWFPSMSPTSSVSCKIYNFLFEACSYATILNVATLSFERYVAICRPLKFQSLSGGRTVKLIVFAWVTSALVALPLLYATGTETPEDIHRLVNKSFVPEDEGGGQNLTFCTNLTPMWAMYRSSVFVAFAMYISVLGSVGFMCNSMIHVLANRKMANLAKGDAQGTEPLPKHESSQAKESRRQTILFLGLIVATLAGCWTPNQIRRLMTAAKPKTEWTVSYLRGYVILHPIADTFFYLSSVLNPFLYSFSSRQFRQVFVQVLRCRLTIEHVNKRNLRQCRYGRSARQILLRSLRLTGRRKDKPDNPRLSGTRDPVPLGQSGQDNTLDTTV